MNRIVRLASQMTVSLLALGCRRGGGAPVPSGALIDLGGQRLHLDCRGRGRPTVLLEAGTGDVAAIWALVQGEVAGFTRVCSYDRGGYAWSEPGTRPRTFDQLALELHTALSRAGVAGPFLLVGQSYGGLVVRGFARRYRGEVAGMVLVDAVHEDQRVVYGGDVHRIRDGATGRPFPEPRIGLDVALIDSAQAMAAAAPPAEAEPLEPPLDRLPAGAKESWRWAEGQPLLQLATRAELDWSPEELARMHQERLANRATLDSLPLIVLGRTTGGYPDGMSIPADSLERERKALQADLAALSSRGRVRFAPQSGHNIHLEDPAFVVAAIHELVSGSSSEHSRAIHGR